MFDCERQNRSGAKVVLVLVLNGMFCIALDFVTQNLANYPAAP